MPKQASGISKVKRYETVKEVLKRWGTLTREEITRRTSEKLGVNANSIKQGVYRDLKEMESAGDIVTEYFSKAGEKIEDYDPQVHRNSVCKFAVANSDSIILGAGVLEKTGCEVHATSLIAKHIRISPLQDKVRNSVQIFWSTGSAIFSLAIDNDALPVTVFLSRVEEPGTSTTLLSKIREKWGARIAALSVPVAKVSSFKSKEKPGHLRITFKTTTELEVEDFGSTNGTSVLHLSVESAAEILETNLSRRRTATRNWARGKTDDEVTLDFKSKTTTLKTPSLIQAGKDFPILIIC